MVNVNCVTHTRVEMYSHALTKLITTPDNLPKCVHTNEAVDMTLFRSKDAWRANHRQIAY